MNDAKIVVLFKRHILNRYSMVKEKHIVFVCTASFSFLLNFTCVKIELYCGFAERVNDFVFSEKQARFLFCCNVEFTVNYTKVKSFIFLNKNHWGSTSHICRAYVFQKQHPFIFDFSKLSAFRSSMVRRRMNRLNVVVDGFDDISCNTQAARKENLMLC